jgi:GAF domain-containing protein/HAMP domain-containing protein
MSIAKAPVSSDRSLQRRSLLRMWQSVRLQTRLTILILIITITVLATVALVISYRAGKSIETLQNQALQDTNNALSSDVSTWLKLNTQALIELTKLPDIMSMDPMQQRPALEAISSSYPGLFLIHTMDINGNDLARTDTSVLQSYGNQPWFQQARSGTFLTLDLAINPTTGKPALSIVAPIRDERGIVIGVAAVTSELTEVSQEVLSVTAGRGSTAYLVDFNNRVVAHPDPTYTTTELRDLSNYPPVAMMRLGARGQIGFTDENNQRWKAYVNVSDNGWGIIVQQPESSLLAPVRAFQGTAAILVLAGALIMFMAAWFTIRRTLQPIADLTRTAAAIAAGDLEQTVKINSFDEVGTLAEAFNEMTAQLKNTIGSLEQRVTERTRALERRSAEIQMAAQIARDASLAQDMGELLNRAARFIHARFNYYHVGIFLLDKNGEYAVLRAAGGEAGLLMLANKHKLKVGEVGMVGHVTRTGEARIALDVGTDAFHFQHPLLPYTRSEMTLPLKAGNRLVGALDIQSDKVNAFDQNDISIMQVLADQISVAYERTLLLQELRQNTIALEQTLQENTSRAWQIFMQQTHNKPGYRYEGITIEPISAVSPDSMEALEKSKTTLKQNKKETGKPGSVLSVPIRLRGQTLGILRIQFQGEDIPAETTRLVEEASGRLALALENARLIQDARRLATRERQIGAISAQIQQSTDLETVLQNTVKELGNTLGVPRAFIQIGLKPSEEDGQKI